ncbi:uncharacterized protein VTP21DRAFT_9618 [Calcarisporiella thermophila]|uniref:uncharacterized protein n=1 Tax=Calcarisporiella thermophila TaxID=911321 RepID=UPI0037447C82
MSNNNTRRSLSKIAHVASSSSECQSRSESYLRDSNRSSGRASMVSKRNHKIGQQSVSTSPSNRSRYDRRVREFINEPIQVVVKTVKLSRKVRPQVDRDQSNRSLPPSISNAPVHISVNTNKQPNGIGEYQQHWNNIVSSPQSIGEIDQDGVPNPERVQDKGAYQNPERDNSQGNSTVIASANNQVVDINVLALLREELRTMGLSPDAQQLILNDCKDTAKHYGYTSAQCEWVSWCVANNTPPFKAPAAAIANFMAKQRTQGKSIGACRKYYLAIGELQIGNSSHRDSLVTMLLRAIEQLAPPIDLVEDRVDVAPVFDYFRRSPNAALTLEALTHKLAWLFAVATYSQVSDLDHMDLQSITIEDDVLRGKIIGNRRRAIKPFHIRRNPDPFLCPINCFIEYTKRWHANDRLWGGSKLFLHPDTAHPATPYELSLWIEAIFKIADPQLFAHDIRNISATSAIKELDVDTVIALGIWKSSSEFDLYNRVERVRNANVTSRILSTSSIGTD